MTEYGSIADDVYLNATLNTEMPLPSERETLMHFFEQIRKRFPTMKNFYSRERAEFVLEEDKESGFNRWTALEAKRISSGWSNPATLASGMELHAAVMELIPYTLGVSPLDCETLNLTVGFDFAYRGNQQELVWEALGYASGFERGLDRPGRRLIGNDYGMTVALDEDCRTQFRLHIEPRTTAYAIKSGEFGEEPLSVYVTVRRYGSLEGDDSYASLLERLFQHADSLIKEFVVDQVLLPIQHTISIR